MRAIQRILLATDFSDSAEPATEAAILMAQNFGVPLTLLYVYSTPRYLGALHDTYVVPLEIVHQLHSDAQRALNQLRERVSTAGVEVDTLAMEGLVREVIVEVARTHGVGLIVMGTHGSTGFRHFLLGSTAERVIRTAPCPVLTVRAPATATKSAA